LCKKWRAYTIFSHTVMRATILGTLCSIFYNHAPHPSTRFEKITFCDLRFSYSRLMPFPKRTTSRTTTTFPREIWIRQKFLNLLFDNVTRLTHDFLILLAKCVFYGVFNKLRHNFLNICWTSPMRFEVLMEQNIWPQRLWRHLRTTHRPNIHHTLVNKEQVEKKQIIFSSENCFAFF